MADRDRATQLLCAIIDEYRDSADPRNFAVIFERVKALPQRFSDLAGEPVDLDIDRDGDGFRQTVRMTILGRDSGHCYGQLTLTLANDCGRLKLDPITAMPLLIWCSLNHPRDMPEWVLQALGDRGMRLIGCDFCEATFVTWREAAAHERRAHPEQFAA